MGQVQSTPVYFGPVSESIFPSPDVPVCVCVCQCHAYIAGLYIDSATTLLAILLEDYHHFLFDWIISTV